MAVTRVPEEVTNCTQGLQRTLTCADLARRAPFLQNRGLVETHPLLWDHKTGHTCGTRDQSGVLLCY